MAVTWNPSDKGANVTLSNGNMSAEANATNADSVRATDSKSSGKWYWEVLIDATPPAGAHTVGVGTSSASITERPGQDANGYGYESGNGEKGNNNSWELYGNNYTTNDVIGIALDLDNGKLWFAKNNVWQDSGDPTAGTGAAYTGLSGTFFPMYSPTSVGGGPDPADKATVRFTAAAQTYSPPSGFSALDNVLTATNLLDGKVRIKSVATNLLDGKVAVNTPTNLLDGKVRIKSVATNLLDGKARIRNNATNLLDGKARIRKSATNLLDGKIYITYTAQMDATCPTPTCEMAATFRYARLQAKPPTPTASFRVGKRIEDECPAPDFTCNAHVGRNPSIVASAPIPTCSMRIGVKLIDSATLFDGIGVPVPTCSMVADTHHLVDLYGNVPIPTCRITASSENIAIISASAPCPQGLFAVTVGNVASIYGRVPAPAFSARAITGIVVSLRGNVPVPGPLVRFYASLANTNITLAGNMPVPTITISVPYSMLNSALRHERGRVR